MIRSTMAGMTMTMTMTAMIESTDVYGKSPRWRRESIWEESPLTDLRVEKVYGKGPPRYMGGVPVACQKSHETKGIRRGFCTL
jgi:hypothetical protein